MATARALPDSVETPRTPNNDVFIGFLRALRRRPHQGVRTREQSVRDALVHVGLHVDQDVDHVSVSWEAKSLYLYLIPGFQKSESLAKTRLQGPLQGPRKQ
eukprot:2358552-Heterocapsa_arctica.AAC.1